MLHPRPPTAIDYAGLKGATKDGGPCVTCGQLYFVRDRGRGRDTFSDIGRTLIATSRSVFVLSSNFSLRSQTEEEKNGGKRFLSIRSPSFTKL